MKQLLLHVRPDQTTLALLDNDTLSQLFVERAGEEDIVGRVYKGVIKNVVPFLSGMFVDIGIGRNAFLRDRDTLKGAPRTEGASILVQVEKTAPKPRDPWSLKNQLRRPLRCSPGRLLLHRYLQENHRRKHKKQAEERRLLPGRRRHGLHRPHRRPGGRGGGL